MEISTNESLLTIQTKDFILTKKLACFDLDGTLVVPKSKRKFAKDASDWRWFHPSVPNKLKELIHNNYSIIILSNQNGLKTDAKRLIFIEKIKQINAILKIPFLLRASLLKDGNRKPNVGMFDFSYDIAQYVGDAAGREDDFSASDRCFALNLGIPFQTPEIFFMNQEPRPYSILDFKQYQTPNIPFIPRENEVIIFVGPPASGKTSYYSTNIKQHNYAHLNLDTLKTRKMVMKEYSKLLGKQSIVIDETSPKLATRKAYLDLALKQNIPVRAFIFETPEEILIHNNMYRHLVQNKKLIPDIVYRMYRKNYVEPTIDEGFEEIVRVPFTVLDNDPNYVRYYS